jgi:pyruvate/2-oxoglutarate dehydrogenase complex dihydrolipoamide acyltransferase (E2) component
VQVGAENVAAVSTDDISTGPLISGTLMAEKDATVRAEASGSLLQATASEGQTVRRGQLLARIEDQSLGDANKSAQSAVRSAEQALGTYLRELHAVGHLEIIATLTREANCSPTPLGFRSPEIAGTHVIARTRSLPQRYYYRRRMPAPDEPMNYFVLARSLAEHHDDLPGALKVARRGAALPKLPDDRVESQDALVEIREYASSLEKQIRAVSPDNERKQSSRDSR